MLEPCWLGCKVAYCLAWNALAMASKLPTKDNVLPFTTSMPVYMHASWPTDALKVYVSKIKCIYTELKEQRAHACKHNRQSFKKIKNQIAKIQVLCLKKKLAVFFRRQSCFVRKTPKPFWAYTWGSKQKLLAVLLEWSLCPQVHNQETHKGVPRLQMPKCRAGCWNLRMFYKTYLWNCSSMPLDKQFLKTFPFVVTRRNPVHGCLDNKRQSLVWNCSPFSYRDNPAPVPEEPGANADHQGMTKTIDVPVAAGNLAR